MTGSHVLGVAVTRCLKPSIEEMEDEKDSRGRVCSIYNTVIDCGIRIGENWRVVITVF